MRCMYCNECNENVYYTSEGDGKLDFNIVPTNEAQM